MRKHVDRAMVEIVHLMDRLHQRWLSARREWPVETGQYVVGDPDCPVAVCTLGSLDLMHRIGRREGIAITGKTFTENLGVEKMVRNIVTNPSIRFLLLCGKESPHRVGQTVVSLRDNGVDDRRHVIGARGKLPLLKNLEMHEIERFREQVEIVDLSGERDVELILERVAELRDCSPGRFAAGPDAPEPRAKSPVEAVVSWHKESLDYEEDPAGFFVIQVNHELGRIEVEHHSNDLELLRMLSGTTALEVCSTIIRGGWVTVFGHAAYLGRELQKAETALRREWIYEQNKDLIEP